jgi:hypothetical protein
MGCTTGRKNAGRHACQQFFKGNRVRHVATSPESFYRIELNDYAHKPFDLGDWRLGELA